MRVRITDIQRFCLHDGPGIRTTVFFQGCPLRCIWCQNPECLTAAPSLRFTALRCIGCGECAAVCRHRAHVLNEQGHEFDRSRCEACGRCAEVCPTGALGLAGEEWTPEQIVEKVARDCMFYRTTGGGMTLSGGEPLAQAAAAQAVLALARQAGIHTAVETCGAVPWEAIELVRQLVDLWLFDVKHLDSGVHNTLTGRGNEGILDNLDRLLAVGAAVVVRVPVIPGRNDGKWTESTLPAWLGERQAVREVHLMPHHRLAAAKYRSLGLAYALEGVEAPSEGAIEALKARLQRSGLRVRVGG